jgi:tetratricopeptide (TPR) repeat protein
MFKLSKLFISVSMLAFVISLNAQDVKRMTYDAYLSGTITLWESAVQESASQVEANPSSEAVYQHALALYGLLNATLKDESEKYFDKYDDDLEKQLDLLIERDYKSGDAHALMAALFGFRIAYAPWKGMYYGPKSSSYLDDALELSPESPVVQKMYASNQMFTPEMWGGSIDNALTAYTKSNELFEDNGDTLNWMYLDNMAWIGMIHKNKSNDELALQVWNEALALEPDFNWVSKGLIPSIK